MTLEEAIGSHGVLDEEQLREGHQQKIKPVDFVDDLAFDIDWEPASFGPRSMELWDRWAARRDRLRD